VISSAGGLHKFIQHKTPIMTDSGGFQVHARTHARTHAHMRDVLMVWGSYVCAGDVDGVA
jgi:tRNA-guanine family transglycosylase